MLQNYTRDLCFALGQINHTLWHVKSMSCTLYTYNAADNSILEFNNILHPSSPQMCACTQLQLIFKIIFDKKPETYIIHGPDML